MTRTPWHHWPVSVLALAWYVLICTDYVLARLQIGPFSTTLSLDQQEFFAALPLWTSLAWAIAVWSGLAGAVLLARRNHSGAVMLAVSFVGKMLAAAGMIFLTQPGIADIYGAEARWILLAGLALGFLFFLYARAMNVRLRRA